MKMLLFSNIGYAIAPAEMAEFIAGVAKRLSCGLMISLGGWRGVPVAVLKRFAGAAELWSLWGDENDLRVLGEADVRVLRDGEVIEVSGLRIGAINGVTTMHGRGYAKSYADTLGIAHGFRERIDVLLMRDCPPPPPRLPTFHVGKRATLLRAIEDASPALVICGRPSNGSLVEENIGGRLMIGIDTSGNPPTYLTLEPRDKEINIEIWQGLTEEPSYRTRITIRKARSGTASPYY